MGYLFYIFICPFVFIIFLFSQQPRLNSFAANECVCCVCVCVWYRFVDCMTHYISVSILPCVRSYKIVMDSVLSYCRRVRCRTLIDQTTYAHKCNTNATWMGIFVLNVNIFSDVLLYIYIYTTKAYITHIIRATQPDIDKSKLMKTKLNASTMRYMHRGSSLLDIQQPIGRRPTASMNEWMKK